jgi:hypothetical protein
VVDEDIAMLRASLGEQGVASRVSQSVGTTITGRLRAGATDVLDQARQAASDNRGILAVLVGAILLWLMRGPLLALLDDNDPETDDNQDALTGEAADPAPLAEGE